jgi:hypothetical protein
MLFFIIKTGYVVLHIFFWNGDTTNNRDPGNYFAERYLNEYCLCKNKCVFFFEKRCD